MIFYRAKRVGKNGKPFTMLKFRTMKLGNNGSFATEDRYTWCGKFLRKTRIDELPQIWNILRGDMRIVGIRPIEESTFNLYPEHVRNRLLSIRPGWFTLSGVFFIEEEKILQLSEDPHLDYWQKILPIKLALDYFYIENKCFILDLVIIWLGIKKGFSILFKK